MEKAAAFPSITDKSVDMTKYGPFKHVGLCA